MVFRIDLTDFLSGRFVIMRINGLTLVTMFVETNVYFHQLQRGNRRPDNSFLDDLRIIDASQSRRGEPCYIVNGHSQ